MEPVLLTLPPFIGSQIDEHGQAIEPIHNYCLGGPVIKEIKVHWDYLLKKPAQLVAGVIFITTIWLVFFAFRYLNSGTNSIFIQVSGFVLAFAWIANQSFHRDQNQENRKLTKTFDWLWLALVAAIMIRIFANSIFPFKDQTGFEEIQTGSNAFRIMLTWDLPIEFRFTNIFASLGFMLGRNLTLTSLRILFQVGGIISLVFMFLSLKAVRIHKLAILVTILMAAANKYLVLGSGIADELFFSILFLMAYAYCLIELREHPDQATFWAGLAGILSGIISFEYISYRMPVAVLGIWTILSLLRDQLYLKKKTQWTIFTFLLCWFLIALPTIVQTIKMPADSVFFEGVTRHLQERSSFFVSDMITQLLNNFKALFGLVPPMSELYTPLGTPLYSPLYGVLFFAGLLFNLFAKRARFSKGFALAILLTVAGLSVFSNNNNIGRLTPVIPLLILLSGDFSGFLMCQIEFLFKKYMPKAAIVYSVVTREDGSEKHNAPTQAPVDPDGLKKLPQSQTGMRIIRLNHIYDFLGRVILAALLMTFIGVAIGLEIRALQTMVRDVRVRKEYANDEFAVCSFLGSVYRNDTNVYFVSESGNTICATTLPEGWYYNREIFPVHDLTLTEFKTHQFVAGDLIILAEKNSPLSLDGINTLMKVAVESNSAYTYRTKENLSGYIVAASVCYQCDQ